MTILVALAIACVSFGLQVRPRLRNRYYGIDTWRHLAVADYIRRHHRYPTRMPEAYLIDEPCDYPPLFRYLLAAIPKRVLEEYQWVVSPACDFCHNMLVYGVATRLSGQPVVGWLAQLVYALTPLVVMENASLTTRSCSSLLFTLAAGGLMTGVVTGSWGFGLVGVFGVALLVLTHKMALQALIVFAVGVGAWSGTLWYGVGVVAGMALAVLMSRGFYLNVLAGHQAMLAWWRQNIRYRYAHQVRGFSRSEGRTPDKVFWIFQQIQKAPWMAVVGANPWAVVVIGYAVWASKAGGWGILGLPIPMAVSLVRWCVVLWLAGCAIRSIRAIEFLGEGERYLEYAAFPVAVLTGSLLWSLVSSPWRFWALTGAAGIATVGCLLPILLLQHSLVSHDEERSVTPQLRQIFDQINRLPGEVRLASFPLYLADSVMYFTRARVLSTDSTLGHLRHYTPFFPVLQVPVGTLVAQYRLTHLLVNERFVSLSELKLDPLAIVTRAGPFCLIGVHGD